MVAAQYFNQRSDSGIEQVCSVVTSGTAWKFVILKKMQLCIDTAEYYRKDEVDKILAILLQSLQQYLVTDSNR
ncbi:MAG: hypothetical protein AAF959_19405 [Cyanobacteria bacterium P01_D01_bin.56]